MNIKCTAEQRSENGAIVFDVITDGFKIGEFRKMTPDYPEPSDYPKIGYAFFGNAGPIGPETMRAVAGLLDTIRLS